LEIGAEDAAGFEETAKLADDVGVGRDFGAGGLEGAAGGGAGVPFGGANSDKEIGVNHGIAEGSDQSNEFPRTKDKYYILT
jgi:hypothetical protein